MAKKSALEIIESAKNKPVSFGYFIDYDIWEEVEEHIAKFILDHKVLCTKAQDEGWIGESWKKGKNGLLGYMRTSFALQLKILGGWKNALPIYQSEFVNYFRSSFFKDTVLQNGSVKAFYKNEHLELLTNK